MEHACTDIYEPTLQRAYSVFTDSGLLLRHRCFAEATYPSAMRRKELTRVTCWKEVVSFDGQRTAWK
jgi:hypothetical protein